MREFFDTVMKKLTAELGTNSKEGDPIRRNALGMELVKAAFRELHEHEEFKKQYVNCDVPSFIAANKEYFPALLSQYLFYELSYALEIDKRYSTEEDHDYYCKRLSASVREFFSSQQELISYYYSGRTDRDHDIFLNSNTQSMPDLAKGMAGLHKNGGALQIAMLLAFERFMLPVKAGSKDAAAQEEVKLHRVIWERDLVDLAELVLGQFECKSTIVDGKPATLDYLIQQEANRYENVTEKQLIGAIRGVTNRKKASEFHRELAGWLERRQDRLLEK